MSALSLNVIKIRNAANHVKKRPKSWNFNADGFVVCFYNNKFNIKTLSPICMNLDEEFYSNVKGSTPSKGGGVLLPDLFLKNRRNAHS